MMYWCTQLNIRFLNVSMKLNVQNGSGLYSKGMIVILEPGPEVIIFFHTHLKRAKKDSNVNDCWLLNIIYKDKYFGQLCQARAKF